MNRSTEVALHHLGSLRKKLMEAKVYHEQQVVRAREEGRTGFWQMGYADGIEMAIKDLDAEITALVADDAKRDGLGQQILDAIRMDTPDLRDDEDEAPFTVNDIRMDTPDMMGCTDPQAEFIAQGAERREEP